MARGLIGKAIRGATAAAIPLVLEQARNKAQAERDARLQEFGMQSMKSQQQYATGERIASQEAAATENQLNRNQQTEQFNAELGVRKEQLGMQQATLKASLDAADAALQEAKLGLVEKQQIKNLKNVLMSEVADEKGKQNALNDLNILLGKAQEEGRFQGITLYEPGPPDDLGNPTQVRRSAVLNQKTGNIESIEDEEKQPNFINWSDLK